jgi:hypothetical protein
MQKHQWKAWHLLLPLSFPIIHQCKQLKGQVGAMHLVKLEGMGCEVQHGVHHHDL